MGRQDSIPDFGVLIPLGPEVQCKAISRIAEGFSGLSKQGKATGSHPRAQQGWGSRSLT